MKRLLLLITLTALLVPWASNAQQSIPYSEGFENVSSGLPTGWTKVGSGTVAVQATASQVHDGSSSLKFSGATSNVVALPQFSVEISTLQISFWSKAEGNYSSCGSFDVGYVTSLTDASTFVQIQSDSYLNFTSYGLVGPVSMASAPDGAYIAFRHRPSSTYYYWFVDDIIVEAIPACPKPTQLSATNVTHEQATISWESDKSAFELVYSTTASFDPDAATPIAISTKNYTLTSLSASTPYYVYVRSACGADGNSAWSDVFQFSTTAVATVVGDSWSDDFEGASCGWELINGTLTNAWAWGEAASNGGTHSLYISNDGGTTNAYTISSPAMVYATKLLGFENGKYMVSFDWEAYGENNSDYLRVALVPASVDLAAGTSTPSGFGTTSLPSGWIALDGGSKLNLVSSWQHQEVAVNVAGNYYLVLAWRDDSSVGTQPPAAVDNVNIVKFACPYDVADLAVSYISTTGATLTWTAGEATQWQVAYADNSSFENAIEDIVSSANKGLIGLQSASEYYVKVRAYCGGEDFGAWSDVITFVTKCEAIDLSVASWPENFDSYTGVTSGSTNNLPICWNYINTCTYSSYKGYPVIYNSSTTSASGDNYLRFYSYYSSYTDYDPQPQYAILPPMSNLAGKQITLQARGYNTSSTFKIGTMADPADASSFSPIADEQTLTTSYQEFVFDIPNTTDSYVAIMIDAANSTRSTNGVYIDDIVIANPPACPKPTDLVATLTPGNGSIATLSWNIGDEETAWQICLDGDEENLIAASTNPYQLTGLIAETVHTAKVRAYCNATDQSAWSNEVSFEPTAKIIIGSGTGTTGYLPSYTNYDYSLAQQIFTVAELGDAGLIESIDFYMTSTSAITRNLDIYMVSTDKENFESATDWVPVSASNLVFSGEVDFVAQAWTTITLDNGFIYNGTKNVVLVVDDNTGSYSSRYFKSFTASDQALYKYQDDTDIPVNYTGSGSLGASKNQIRILKGELPACAKPTGLASSEIGKTSVTLSWTENGNATAWDIMLNNDAENLVVANTNPFVLNGLSAETDYVVTVRANCGGSQSEWSSEINFTTLQACPASTSLAVVAASETAHGATISWDGDADSYNALYGIPSEVDAFSADFEDNAIGAEFINSTTYPWVVTSADKHEGTYSVKSGNAGADGSSSELSLNFTLSGEGSISFWAKVSSEENWDKGYFFIDGISKINGISGVGSWTQYNYDLTSGEHTFVWKYSKDGSGYENDDCFYVDDIQITDNIVSSWVTISDVESPYTFTNLQAESTYQVKVQSVCGGTPGHETESITFTTASACQTADNLAADGITASTAQISWNAYGQTGFNLRYSVDGTNWVPATSDNSPYTITGLDPNTSYEVQVQPTCAGADEWSASLNFKTECEAITITFNAPYVEDFEDPIVTTTYNQAGQMPDCWEGYPATYAGPKILAAGKSYNYASSGQVLYFYGSGNNYAVLPKISNPLSDLQISFKWATESSSNGTLTLGYIADNDADFNTFKAIKAFPASSASYRQLVQENIFLDTLPASASKLVFRWYYSGQYGCNVDDIIIRLANIVDINASEYATYFNSEKAYIMPAGVTGHAFANGVLSDAVYQSADVVPAAIPLVLHGPAGSYLLASSSEAGAPLSVANDLIGVNIETEIEDESGYLFYVLSLAAGKNPSDLDANVGFYWMNATGAGGFTLPAHKAYLKYGASSAPAAFYLFNGENNATWLNSLEGVEGTVKFMHEGNIYILRDSIIYDATGRKVRELK